MSDINKQARDKLKSAAAKAADNFDPNMFVETRDVLGLLDELEAVQTVSAARLVAIDTTHKMFQRERDRAEKAEKRIAELEAREVVLPQRYSMLHRVDFDEPYHTEMVYKQHQVLEALHDAGVNVAAAAGKGEAS